MLLLHLDGHLLLLVQFLRAGLFHCESFLLGCDVGPLSVFLSGLELGLFRRLFCVGQLLHLLVLSLLLLLVFYLDSALLHDAAHHVLLLNLEAFRQEHVQNGGLVNIRVQVDQRLISRIGRGQVAGSIGRQDLSKRESGRFQSEGLLGVVRTRCLNLRRRDHGGGLRGVGSRRRRSSLQLSWVDLGVHLGNFREGSFGGESAD